MVSLLYRRRHNVEELHKALEVFGTGAKCKNNGLVSVAGLLALTPRDSPLPPPPPPPLPPQPPPIQASPLLKDSRHWTDNAGDNLPGSIDDGHSFSDSIMKTLDQRLSFKEILTPVMENTQGEDFKSSLSDDEDEEDVIVSATTQQNLEKGHRRRAHSLTKSTSTISDQTEANHHDDVFAHPPPSTSAPSNLHQKAMFSSKSEDNLLQCSASFSPEGEEEEEEEEGRESNFEVEIKKLLVESSGGKSAGSSSSDLQDTSGAGSSDYKPYHVPDLQALLMESSSAPTSPRSLSFSPSSSQRTTPAHSLPRNFRHHPSKQHRIPLRQFSEGQIQFQVTSPPLTSPVSLTSVGKVSSQGSFSEGFSEELQEEGSLRRKRLTESSLEQEEGVDEVGEIPATQKKGEGVGKEEEPAPVRPPRRRDKTTDSGIEDPASIIPMEDDPHISDDIPLPDNSPAIQSLHVFYKNSESRDSGLSDSPDPFADTHKLSLLQQSASNLMQSNRQGAQDGLSLSDSSQQLASTGSSSHAVSTTVDDSSRHADPCCKPDQEGQPSAIPLTRPDSSQIITEVLKVAPTPNLKLIDPDECSMHQHASDRLRMMSPDEILPPTQRTIKDNGMKRSQSHGEALAKDPSQQLSFSHQTKHGRLIIMSDSSNSKHSDSTEQSSLLESEMGNGSASGGGGGGEGSKGKTRKKKKFKSSESINEIGGSPRSHRRTPFFV